MLSFQDALVVTSLLVFGSASASQIHSELQSQILTCLDREILAEKSCKWAYDDCLLDLKDFLDCKLAEIEDALQLLVNITAQGNMGMTTVVPPAVSNPMCSCQEEIALLAEAMQPLINQTNCENAGGTYCSMHQTCLGSILSPAETYREAITECNGSNNIWRRPPSQQIIADCFSNFQGNGTVFYAGAPMLNSDTLLCPGFAAIDGNLIDRLVPCDNATAFYACQVQV